LKNYDLIDEAVIDADHDTVWDSLIEELRGAGRWWVPHNTFAPLSGSPDRVGGTVRVTVHLRGADRTGPTLKFVSRTLVCEPGRLLGVEYVHGVFRGPSEFVLDPLDGGRRTRLGMHFRARPHGWLKPLARMAPIDVEHSRATRAAFSSLARILSEDHALPGGGR